MCAAYKSCLVTLPPQAHVHRAPKVIVKIFQSCSYYVFFMCVNILHIVLFNANHSEAFTVWQESSSVDELQPKAATSESCATCWCKSATKAWHLENSWSRLSQPSVCAVVLFFFNPLSFLINNAHKPPNSFSNSSILKSLSWDNFKWQFYLPVLLQSVLC